MTFMKAVIFDEQYLRISQINKNHCSFMKLSMHKYKSVKICEAPPFKNKNAKRINSSFKTTYVLYFL